MREDSRNFLTLSSPWPRFVFLSVQTLVQTRHAVVSQALLFVFRTSCSRSKFCVRQEECSSVLVSCRALVRSVKCGDLKVLLEVHPSVSYLGEMITVEYEEEARFFPQSDFEDSFDSGHLLHFKKLDDPPSVRFWTLIPDSDVYPEMPLVPSATGRVWLDGRNLAYFLS